jgi:oligopeptidase A
MPSSHIDVNPLLDIQFSIPFDRILAGHVEPAIAELIGDARNRLEALASDPGERTFDNTMLELETMTERLDYAIGVIRHLESVATYPELRAAYNAVQPAVTEFYSSIPLHAGLWSALKRYAQTEEAGSLTGTRKRLLQKTLDSFRRHGADLDAEGKERLAEIDVELGNLTTKFSENVLDSTNAFDLVITEEQRLEGLPESARTAGRESAQSKQLSGWRFTLQAPSYIALMTYLRDAEIREAVYHAHATRATSDGKDNRPIINRILELRREKARLLNFDDFSDFALEDRMAKSGATAEEFLVRLKEKTGPAFHRENQELLRFRKEIEGEDAPELQPWDIGYYAEKQRVALYEFDEEELRPYFPLDNVVRGMFDTVGKLFGIRVTEQPGRPVWDPSVKFYDIHDEDGTWIGSFYADWFPRENKRGGAWMDAFLTGLPSSEGFKPHLGLICGNLTPPAGGKPSLLTHREVETIFHEFGHLLHHCLSRVEVRSLAGTNVAWDFVELPSQIMENWCWEREALDLFALHYLTGEPIPQDLYEKMKRARNFRSANAQMRQLGFGLADLALHRHYDPKRDGDVVVFTRVLFQEFSPAPLPEDHAMIASFTHLFSSPVGYAAGYYSYKWAEVLDADAFTRFQQSGIFSREVGTEFRSCILCKGDSEDPADLYRSFMGRDPDPEALLRRSGLLVAEVPDSRIAIGPDGLPLS